MCDKEKDRSEIERLRAERLRRLIEPAEKEIREGCVTPMREFFKEFKAACCRVLGVLCVLIFGVWSMAHSNSVCPGPRHFQKKTKECIYDVQYPALSNPEMECKVRNWIDLQIKDFNDGPELDPAEHRPNEYWITNEVFRSGGLESFLVEEYEYAQGAHGTSEIHTTTYDVTDGEEYEFSDVIDMNKDWYKAVSPYATKLMDDVGSVIITRGKAEEGVFNHFVIDKSMITFIFDEESIGPHGEGNVRLDVPLRALKKVLKPDFEKRYLRAEIIKN